MNFKSDLRVTDQWLPASSFNRMVSFRHFNPPMKKLPEPQHGKKSKKPGIDARGNQAHNDTPAGGF